MITVSEAIAKMITVCEGNQYDICHFMKVWAYAKTIGELEGVDEKTQRTLEYAAIVHDIACPSLRKEYGSAPGNLQEEYGPPLVREFYKDAGMEEETLERVCYLVSRHHTFTDVEGMDHRILLECRRTGEISSSDQNVQKQCVQDKDRNRDAEWDLR